MARTIITGNAPHLARGVARRLGADHIRSKLHVFADGEGKITLESRPKRGAIIVIQSTHPPVDSNLIQALLLIGKARKFSANVTAVIPYMGYARQDKEFIPGEIITLDIISGLFRAAGAKKIITIDIHSVASLKKFGITSRNITAIPELARRFKRLNLRDPLVVSPDLGGAGRAKEFAEVYGSDHIALKKHRDKSTGRVRIMNSSLHDVKGRDTILVDDMISTGGSIIKATRFLKGQKCRRVFVACTHALLVGGAQAEIKKAGVARIVSANTIPGSTNGVDVSGLIAKAV